jgi:hypothetical protein
MEGIHFMNGIYSRVAGLEVSPALGGWNKTLILRISSESPKKGDWKLMLPMEYFPHSTRQVALEVSLRLEWHFGSLGRGVVGSIDLDSLFSIIESL